MPNLMQINRKSYEMSAKPKPFLWRLLCLCVRWGKRKFEGKTVKEFTPFSSLFDEGTKENLANPNGIDRDRLSKSKVKGKKELFLRQTKNAEIEHLIGNNRSASIPSCSRAHLQSICSALITSFRHNHNEEECHPQNKNT